MKDTKRKLMPDSSWETGTMEAWLEDMFAQGWQLEECGFRFAKFRRAEPAKVRCRMMPMQNETFGDQKERETLYEELGWKAEKTLDDMCADSLRWQRMNPNGFED